MVEPLPCQKTKRAQAWKAGFVRETWGAWYLRFKGYRILERRFKTPFGEIDLIAKKGNVFVFVEVKYRAHLDASLESLGSRQRTRIIGGAQYYLKHRGINFNGVPCRFDGLFFSNAWFPKHIINAWGDSDGSYSRG